MHSRTPKDLADDTDTVVSPFTMQADGLAGEVEEDFVSRHTHPPYSHHFASHQPKKRLTRSATASSGITNISCQPYFLS